ncbi:MAG: 16S rRNA (cytidine(1402)-2'-O)-methyltransferase [Clostridia bacterium]|nr:16S rRNA (cytidine(1402)-2'-O)-methyltransferase [Clostridia bacterium]
MEKGILYLVATPIGNLEDITLRALNVLKEVDIILAEDTRKTLKLLNHFEISKKLISFYRHNEGVKLDYVISLLEEGKNLALVSDAGTPGISDPGEDLVKACIDNKIQIVPIPGAVAFIQGLICSGFDTTRFVFEGFLPMNKRGRRERLASLKEETRTMIFYEAPHKLKYTVDDLLDAFGDDRKVVFARELTKIHEEYLRMTLKEAKAYYEEKEIKGEFVVLVEGKTIDEKANISQESIEDLMKKYLSEGLDKKDAMKKVAKEKGITKSEVYKHLL